MKDFSSVRSEILVMGQFGNRVSSELIFTTEAQRAQRWRRDVEFEISDLRFSSALSVSLR
jgi:hypothetical protein